MNRSAQPFPPVARSIHPLTLLKRQMVGKRQRNATLKWPVISGWI